MDISMLVKVGIVGAALAAFGIAHYVFKAKDDSPIEQLAEKVIKEETGVDMDLTPSNK